MFDDLRNSSNDDSAFFQDADAEIDPLLSKKPKKGGMGVKINSNTFLGMTAFQRFVISMLLLMMVCIIGTMALMITGAISLF